VLRGDEGTRLALQ